MTTAETAPGNALPELDKEDLRRTVAHVLDLDPDEVTDEALFIEDLEVDSLLSLEVVVVLEQKYGIRLDENELREITSMGGAYEVMRRKVTSA